MEDGWHGYDCVCIEFLVSLHHDSIKLNENLHELPYEMLSNIVKNVLHLDLRISCGENFWNVKILLTLYMKMDILRAS